MKSDQWSKSANGPPGHTYCDAGPAYLDAHVAMHPAGQFAQVMQRVFDRWEWDTIIPCHGNIVRGNGKAALRGHLKLEQAAT